MTPATLLGRFRSRMRDEAQPYMWSDADCFEYMDTAHKDFARYSGGIGDSRSGVTYLRLRAGVSYYPLASQIMKVRALVREDNGNDIELLNEENQSNAGIRRTDAAGRVTTVIVGADQDFVRVYPVPDAGEEGKNLRLTVYRMPLNCIVDGNSEFEIQEQHHIHLMDGMAGYAYRKQDAETFDKGRADQFTETFRRYCDQAKQEREKREYKPRGVQFGDGGVW